ncbi:MAG TPA: response regulator [Bacteroidales bacterium]|nr:response regulator [Bacteroidales bacterium]
MNHYNKNSGNEFPEGKKKIETLTIAALVCLIFAVIFISFNVRLLAGIMIITAAALLVLVARKTSGLIRIIGESYRDAAATAGKKEEVIAEFSHRIREPLNNLVIISDLLMESGLQKKQKDLLETFIASTGNMVSTVNELTIASAGSISFSGRKKVIYNILSTTQNTIDLFNLHKKSNLDIVFSKREFSGFESVGDPVILKQILLDIFSSIESTGTDHTVRVSVNVRKEKEGDTEKIISLRIQTDQNRAIIDESGTEGHLASRLIAMNRGDYRQESGENMMVLIITMPFENPPAGSGTTVNENHSGGPETDEAVKHKDLRDCNILFVEDNIIHQKVTLLTLKPLVKNIDIASNGAEAVGKVLTADYDMVLLDIRMPEMDGIITAEKIRNLQESKGVRIPIIAITADAMIDDREKCLSAGIDEYISKPYKPADLIEKMKSLL